jgi:alpha-beta hydrolase superfamily lysophospholipase
MGKSYHVANENGWNQMIDDQWQLLRHIDSQNDLPLVILGHSMGSFMATHLCQKYNVGLNALLGSPLSAVILSGSNYANSATWKIASLIARIERFRVGRAHPSSLLEKISFGHFNNAFKPTRTSSDWLSRDPDIVDAYIADPLCGGPLTSQSWCDFLIGMSELSQTKSMAKLDKNLQIHLFAGQDDPVSNQSKGIIALEKVLLNAGISNVKKTIYPKARHEILNETNRSDVYRDVVTWLASLGFGISDPNKD